MFGRKTANLAAALNVGLRVPLGIAVSEAGSRALALFDDACNAELAGLAAALAFPVAVRSSGLDEDGVTRSMAGQYLTKLNVTSAGELRDALMAVGAGLGRPIPALIQTQIRARAAGVLFTRDPISKSRGVFVEAAWGLGEAVVGGKVVPDQIRFAADGALLEYRTGIKDVEVQPIATGGTREVEVDAERAAARCLTAADCEALWRLARACMGTFGEALDLEWAFDEHGLALLQCRPITA